MQQMVETDPMLKNMVDANPMLRNMLTDSTILQMSLQIMKSPDAMQKIMSRMGGGGDSSLGGLGGFGGQPGNINLMKII